MNDLCCLVLAPPKYGGSPSHILLMCRVFYYVRGSVLFKIHAANIEASKFFCFLSVMENISQMLVVCICYCLDCSVGQQDMDYPWKGKTAALEGCLMDWKTLMMVLGGAVMKRKTFEWLL